MQTRSNRSGRTRTLVRKNNLFRKTRRNDFYQSGGNIGELPVRLCFGAPRPTVSLRDSNFIVPWESTESDMLYINIILSELSPIAQLITEIRGKPLYNKPNKHFCERPHLTLLAVNIPKSAARTSLHYKLSNPETLAHIGRQFVFFLHLYMLEPPHRVLTSPSQEYKNFGKFKVKEYTKFPTLNYNLFKNAIVNTLARLLEDDISQVIQCYPPIFKTAPPQVDHYLLGSKDHSAFAISHFYGSLYTPHISLYEYASEEDEAAFEAIDDHDKHVLNKLEISPTQFDTLFMSFGKQSLINIPIGMDINSFPYDIADAQYTVDTMGKKSFLEGAAAVWSTTALAASLRISAAGEVLNTPAAVKVLADARKQQKFRANAPEFVMRA